MTTIFSRIIKKELPADIVFENEAIIAFRDIYPVAPVHILIVTKKEIKDLQSVKPEDLSLIAEVVSAAQKIAEKEGVASSYRLLTNNGTAVGQTIFHLHFHLIAGRESKALF